MDTRETLIGQMPPDDLSQDAAKPWDGPVRTGANAAERAKPARGFSTQPSVEGLLALTLLRRGELAETRMSDVDFEQNVALVLVRHRNDRRRPGPAA